MPRTLPIYHSLLFALIVLLGACHAKKESYITKKYAAASLQQDVELLEHVVMEMHPAIGVYCSKTQMQTEFVKFKQAMRDSLTEREFRLALKLLLDHLHCGHTEVLYSKKLYKELKAKSLNYSPIVFLPVHEKLYVLGYLGKKQDSLVKKGTQIVSVNGIAADSIIRFSKRFVSGDGFSNSGKEHYVQLGFNSYLVGLFGRPDTFSVKYFEGKELKEERIAAVKLKTMPNLPLGSKDDSLFKKYKRAAIKYRYIDSTRKTMLMKIERFSHTGDGRTYRQLFRKLKKNDCENLVIDLRNNGGGSIANSYRLLSYLLNEPQTQTLKTKVKHYPYRKYTRGDIAFRFTRMAFRLFGKHTVKNDTDVYVYTIKPRKRNHFNGNVMVLINGGSFSASCLVASYLKSTKRAVFIGQETGGGEEGCNAGITPYYRLPNTGIQVRIPAFRIEHDVCAKPLGKGITPDYQTDYTFKDIVTRKDLDLMKVKDLIVGDKKP